MPVGFGADVITVTATTATGTGYAQTTVVGDLVGGTSVYDVTDPSGDDHGPGTYQYPSASDFHDGAFDITRFQVLTKDSTVYLRTTLRDLTPTFGSPLGAQLLDVFVRQPGASPTSTAGAFASRNYTIAPASAWSQRLEVQGFAAPVWVDANGNQVGTASVVASQASKTITIAVPQAAFGTPASGWVVHPRAARSERLQRRSGAAVHGHADRRVRLRGLPVGRHGADLRRRPERGRQADGHDHAERGVAGR